MRAFKKVGLAALVGGASAYAARQMHRQRGAMGRHDDAPEESGERAVEWDIGRPLEEPSEPQTITSRERAGDKEFQVEYHENVDEIRARRTEQADLPVDVTADAAPLVSAERDALTVAGDDGGSHRRRDQTAGEAAQEIAAAQVHQRRSSASEFTDEDE
jgi:hypothetical protein